MFHLLFPILLPLISLIERSEQVQCYGGDQEVHGTQNEAFVDYNCPSLWTCFIVIQERSLGENGTMMVMRKGCVEKADEVDFEGAPPCFNFDFSNLSAEIFNTGFKCTCNKDFCNGGDDPSGANQTFSPIVGLVLCIVSLLLFS